MKIQDKALQKLKHDKKEYENIEKLPNQLNLIKEKDWQVLIVFDACRYDAAEAIIGNVKKVRTPSERSTPEWTQKVWCNNQWPNTTYLSTNPHTWNIRNEEQYNGRYGGKIEKNVKKFVKAYEKCWDDVLEAENPEKLTNLAMEIDEPPMVVHYMQPHTPYIGNLSVNVTGQMETENVKINQALDLAEQGLVDPSIIRKAYLDNLRLAYKHSKKLIEKYDNVIITSDHGEALGPDEWSHGGMQDPRARIVPWKKF